MRSFKWALEIVPMPALISLLAVSMGSFLLSLFMRDVQNLIVSILDASIEFINQQR